MSKQSSSQSSSRKRARPSVLVEDNTPSDPAVFSSDPAEPGAENYFAPRRKKQYKGTWWQNGEKQRQRKAFQRNLDSGIFMGSDSSLESIDSEDVEDPKSNNFIPDEPFEGMGTWRRPAANSLCRPVHISEPAVVIEARQRIASFAENGENVFAKDDALRDSIDLANLGLPYLTDDMLIPMQQMVRQPLWKGNYDCGRPSRQEYGNEEDESLSIYSLDSEKDLAEFDETFDLMLDNNALSDLPPRLFTLSGLRRLRLLNNNLTALSPNVSRLKNLQQLDVAGNRLRWLPGEILDRIHLSESGRPALLVDARQNPLLQPFSYVGFRRLVNDIDGSQSQDCSVIPQSIAELKNRIHRLQQLRPSARLTDDVWNVQFEQRSWLLRLYEHCLQRPELIWSHTRSVDDLLEEERQEIARRCVWKRFRS
ncbi:hypothetical protein, variant [Verruconis gallopava]|uniref:Uncharacterized protein n=1 Tax=Verruconis gallopava TaxID=253628 RepID=A0A0D1YLH4_9PEZI|nr:hypothetical protein, variant [Verruconis gallopava]KIW01682.1 hypothetical protein, variant [Verruconis gallopava]